MRIGSIHSQLPYRIPVLLGQVNTASTLEVEKVVFCTTEFDPVSESLRHKNVVARTEVQSTKG